MEVINRHYCQKWIEASESRPGASGSRIITKGPHHRGAIITMFLQGDNRRCFCMTTGSFISKGEICYLPKKPTLQRTLYNVFEYQSNCLALGKCVLSINEMPDFIIRRVNDILGKMDVALIEVYDDAKDKLNLVLRDKRDAETKVVVGVPDKDMEVQHNKYDIVKEGKITDVDRINGIFRIKPSTWAQEPPQGDCGALITNISSFGNRDNHDGETKVYGMLIAHERFGDNSYHPIALQMDKVIERVQREMNGNANGLRVYTL